MTDLLYQIQLEASQLLPEQQQQVLKFLQSLRQNQTTQIPPQKSLQEHPAFGSWKNRNIDSVEYQRNLRAEWES